MTQKRLKMSKKLSAPQGPQEPQESRSRSSRLKIRRVASLVTSCVALVFVVCLVTGISVGKSGSDRSGLDRDASDPFFDAFVAESEHTGESSGVVKRTPQTGFDRQGFSLGGNDAIKVTVF